MIDPMRQILPWVRFGGFVLAVAVLGVAQEFFVPIALAVLLSFVLTPVVAPLQRLIGRVPAVIAVVVTTFALLGLAGWGATLQLGALSSELPRYQRNLREKIRDVRWLGRGGSMESLQGAIKDLQKEIDGGEQRGSPSQPMVVREDGSPLTTLSTTIGPWLGALGTAGLVIVLVIFMLLERQELRTRLLGAFGSGSLAVTTRALDEATARVSRFLLVQGLINLAFGVGVAIGLTLIGLPYVLLWAALAAVLRFIPYVGPWIGALSPFLVSLAAFDDWTRPLAVILLFLTLELFTNLVLEVVFYAGAAGVSQTGLLVAVAFWTWLWGPLGLLLSTPLTVCLVVLGKYVPGFDSLTTLMTDAPVLADDARFYQRVLASDPGEAAEIVEEHLRREAPETVYDTLLIPALTYAEQDRLADRLAPHEEQAVIATTQDVLGEIPLGNGAAPEAAAEPRARVLGWPANGEADALALRMLARLLEPGPIALDVAAAPTLIAEIVATVRTRGYRAVCIADLPPSPSTKARYFVKRLRAALPDVTIIVGRWAPPDFADEDDARLREVGADAVHTRLCETRDFVRCLPLPAAAPAAAGASAL